MVDRNSNQITWEVFRMKRTITMILQSFRFLSKKKVIIQGVLLYPLGGDHSDVIHQIIYC